MSSVRFAGLPIERKTHQSIIAVGCSRCEYTAPHIAMRNGGPSDRNETMTSVSPRMIWPASGRIRTVARRRQRLEAAPRAVRIQQRILNASDRQDRHRQTTQRVVAEHGHTLAPMREVRTNQRCEAPDLERRGVWRPGPPVPRCIGPRASIIALRRPHFPISISASVFTAKLIFRAADPGRADHHEAIHAVRFCRGEGECDPAAKRHTTSEARATPRPLNTSLSQLAYVLASSGGRDGGAQPRLANHIDAGHAMRRRQCGDIAQPHRHIRAGALQQDTGGARRARTRSRTCRRMTLKSIAVPTAPAIGQAGRDSVLDKALAFRRLVDRAHASFLSTSFSTSRSKPIVVSGCH